MHKQPSPDSRLVYLHCSSIFSGANAQVRRPKAVTRLLQQRKASIKILTEEFPLPAIAAIAKELLEEQIFASLPRAKLRFPELFQTSESQEAERAASEAEVVRIEAEAAQDIVLTSDDDGGDECLDYEQSEQRAEPGEILEGENEAPDNVQISADEPCTQSPTQAHQKHTIPRLHPVYLPFRTQHKILVPVQSLLEECCLEFGNTWVPDLMAAQKWHEAESIELTQWIKKVVKYIKSLPPSAIKPVAGKSITQVFFGTSALRHSAVHRLPTSAAGILNMLSAAITFAEALNDSKRAGKVADIKAQLEASIEEIVQHQNLLQRKLTHQLEDIARRRSELDELEKSSIEEMLATDKKQRTEVGSTFEGFLLGFQQVSNPRACSCTPSFDEPKLESEAGENIDSCGIEYKQKSPDAIHKEQAYNESLLGEEKPHRGKELEEDDRPPWHNSKGGCVEEDPDVLGLTLPTLRSRVEIEKGEMAATSRWDILTTEESPVLLDEAPASEDASPGPVHVTHDMGWKWPQNGVCGFSATRDVPDNAAEGAISVEKSCFTEPEEAYIIADEQPSVEDTFPTNKAVPKEDPIKEEEVAPEATLEASQAERIIEDFSDAEKHPLNQYKKATYNLDDLYEPTSESDVAPKRNAPAEDFELLIPHPGPALNPGCDPDFRPPPPSAPSSIVTSVIEAAVSEAPEDSHSITLKILNGSKVLRSVVFIRACTRTAILNEARRYCVKCAQDDQSLGTLLANGCDLAFVSLRMYGCDMDLSTYKVENLSSLVRTIEKTGIPRFTLRISEI